MIKRFAGRVVETAAAFMLVTALFYAIEYPMLKIDDWMRD